MFPPDAFQPLLTELARLLEARRVRFALTGGIASVLFGEPRYTQDVDVIVGRAELSHSLEALLADFQLAGYLLEPDVVRNAVLQGRQFQLFHKRESLKVDLYPRELVPGELDRAEWVEIFPGVRLPVVSLADLAASKLIWISKGSHKNRRDLRQLMRRIDAQGAAEVQVLAAKMDLHVLLDEVLTERDEIDL